MDYRADAHPIAHVNPSWERLTGYTAAFALGRNARFLQGDDHEQDALPAIREALVQGRGHIAVLRNYRADGTHSGTS